MQRQTLDRKKQPSISIQEALLEEARKNELKLAYLRAASAIVFAVVQLVVYLWPQVAGLANYPLTDTALTAVWSAAAIGLLLALRRGWYRSSLRLVVPLVDAVTIAAAFGLIWYHLDFWGDMVPSGVVVSVTGLCVFLAFSGALRLTRSAAVLTTSLALGVFLFVAAVTALPPAHIAVSSTTIIVTGLLGMGVAGIIRRVVTGEVQRAELEQRYRAAQLAVTARDEILGIVSHDLRNPLNTIFLGAGTLLDEISQDEDRGMERRYLEIIKRAGERMNHLIQDLLNVSKVASGTLTVELRPTEVAPLLAEAVSMLAPLAQERQLELKAEIADTLPDVHADPDRMLQIFSNLAGNAMKFTPAGGAITLQAGRDGDMVRFSVTDTGPGIPEEQLPHIFRRFWQAERSDKRGIGLGLSIVQALVEAHGGRVWVESEVGVGSTFHFIVPVVGGIAESAAQPDARIEAQPVHR